MSEEITSDKSRFIADLREIEIVRNGKRMRWDDNKEAFVEIQNKDDKNR